MTPDVNLSSAARAFIDEVRHAQAENAQDLRGPLRSMEGKPLAIMATITSISDSPQPFSSPIEQPLLKGLLERFEKMAHRNGYEVPGRLRPDILILLATELWVNQNVFKTAPRKLLAVTAYSGAVGVLLPKEFPEFSETPGIFRRAVMGNPANPRGFLHNVQNAIATLAADEEFASFRDTPGIFREAVVCNPGDPRGFLSNVQKVVAELSADDEFASFCETPHMFRRAVIHNPSDPRAWLRSEPTSNWHALRVKARRAKSPASSREPE